MDSIPQKKRARARLKSTAEETDDGARGDLLYLSYDVETRGLNVEKRSIDFVCSTSTEDRYGECVEQTWRLDNYSRNPVVLFAHQSRDLPIGRAEKMRVVPGKNGPQLECTVVFASEKANPKAEQVFQLCREGILKAVSVGFQPKTVRYEVHDGREVAVLADNELCELSVTPVPANPEALAKHLARAVKNIPAPSRAAQENSMTEEELKALRAKAAQLDSVSTELVGVKTSVAEKENALAAKDAVIAERDTKIGTLEKSVTEKDAVIAERDARIAELEVDSLIGKKILPAERDEMLELKKSNPTLFGKMIGKRADMKLLESVTAHEPGTQENGVAKNAADQNGSDLAARASKRAKEKTAPSAR